jgi:hypothetical protein
LSGRGQSLAAIARLALEQVYENEWLSFEDYQTRLQDIADAIASAG